MFSDSDSWEIMSNLCF